MKFINFSALIILFASAICLSSCKKEKEVPLDRLDPEFLSYVSFPVGSRWNYKEISSGKTNVIYLTDSDTSYHGGQRISMKFESPIESFYAQAMPIPCKERNYFFYNFYPSDNFAANSTDNFFYPAKAGQKEPCGLGSLKIESYYDSIIIQGITYRQVYKTNHDGYTEVPDDNDVKSVYFCKNIGVIRRETRLNGIWELTNYHIEK